MNTGAIEGLNQIDSVLAYIGMGEHSPYLMNEFKRVTSTFDQLRGESVTKLVPELQTLMEDPGTANDKLKVAISQARWLGGKIRNRLLG